MCMVLDTGSNAFYGRLTCLFPCGLVCSLSRCVNTALEEKEAELFVLGRHELIVATPGAKDVLTTDKEFKAFKGFDVIIKTWAAY